MKITAIAIACMILFAPFAGTDENEKANQFFEDAFNETLSRSPSFEAQLGIKTHYDQWDDISDAFVIETGRIVERQLSELKSTIDYAELDELTRLSYDLFVYQAELRLEGRKWRYHTYPVNQMYGWQSEVATFMINYHRMTELSDAEKYIVRLSRVDELMDQVSIELRLRADKGIIPPKFVFPYVISDATSIISGHPFGNGDLDCAILADFKEKIAKLELSEEQQADLIGRCEQALIDSVKPGHEALIATLKALELKATADDGAWKFPDGEAYYKYRLKLITSTDMSADKIHKLGLKEVKRIHGEMTVIKETVNFDGTLQEFFAFMRTDPQFYFPETDAGRAEYLALATNIIDTMRGRLDELFIVKPKASLEVHAVEAFREKSAGKAFYERPSPDGSRPGKYYANLYKMSDMPTYQAEALAYHEGIPGHHMQLAIANELEGVPMFRKYARMTAYTEGWGLYSEFLPKEMGFYADPYSDFGRLAMELWRACRLVVDTGIHDKKWTREKAIAYLDNNTPNPHGDVVKAIERYIVMPGQATAYKIGMNRIIELREKSRKQLGPDFDIRGFHDVVLKNGPVPLSTLEMLLDEWVAHVQSGMNATGKAAGSGSQP